MSTAETALVQRAQLFFGSEHAVLDPLAALETNAAGALMPLRALQNLARQESFSTIQAYLQSELAAALIAPLQDAATEKRAFLHTHAVAFLRDFQHCFCRAIELLRANNDPFLDPDLQTQQTLEPDSPASPETLKEWVDSHERFGVHRAFVFGHGRFRPVTLSHVMTLQDFYGFETARAFFKRHFDLFEKAQSNAPLLLTSLPGLGKTQLTLAHTFAYADMTLIIATPDVLENELGALIDLLKTRTNRKFVIFFDDVDTRSVNFYAFRNYVGGCFNPPMHIALVVASNYPFPINILSRGHGFTFPVFDASRCTEMVECFLRSLKMRKPPENLINVIAADYTEAVGQNLYEDLSPRTLMMYLRTYESSADKRAAMMSLSLDELITRPDPQLFFDRNVDAMRALYGESSIDKLREKLMKDYGL